METGMPIRIKPKKFATNNSSGKSFEVAQMLEDYAAFVLRPLDGGRMFVVGFDEYFGEYTPSA